MGSSEDKSEIVKVNVWKKGNNFTIYATYNPPIISPTLYPSTLRAKP